MNTIHALAVSAVVAASTLVASAGDYQLYDRSPDGSVEAFFLGAGGGFGVGWASFPDPSFPVPGARSVRASVWSESTQSIVDIGPAGWSGTFANGAAGNQIVGHGFISGPNIALLWNGLSTAPVTLNTPAMESAVAYATDGITQVGSAITQTSNGESRPFAWNGTAASARQLALPATFNNAAAFAVRGNAIAGTGEDAGFFQAGIYWSDAAAAPIVVRPQGFEETRVGDVAGRTVLGSGYGDKTSFQRHAYIWNVDDIEGGISLHPNDSTYIFSDAVAMLESNAVFPNGVQVGIVGFEDEDFNFIEHAAVWFGSADSFIDLHDLVVAELGESFQWSVANGIDQFGNIYGTAHDGQGNFRSVQWRVVPAPGAVGLALGASLFAARRRR